MMVSTFYAVLILLASVLHQADLQDTGKCTQDIDLVFALDASGSVKEDGFNQIKNFTKDIIDQFEIGVTKTHVAVVTFSEYAEVQLKLTETFDKDEIFKKVDNLLYPGYRTATDDALRVVDKDVLSLSGGARQGVAQIVIFLTDGKCTVCTESVESAVAPLKARGVNIYTVGVTDKINRTELELIASQPVDQYSFTVDNFGDLASIIVDVFTKACSVKKGRCAKPLSPFQCTGLESDICIGDDDCSGEQKCCSMGCFKKCAYPLLNCMTAIDIAFAIDSSKSVREAAFASMKDFAKHIVDSFTVSQTDARFASLTYSDDAEVNFNFVRHSTADKIKRAIDALPHKKSDTRVDKALELAASDIFSLQGGVRTRRPMVLVVFFDGDISRDMKDLVEVATPLKDYGVKIVAVGVGPEVNAYQLNKIASSNKVVYQAKTFDDLLPELYYIAEETCNEKPGKCTLEEKFGDCAESAARNECDTDFDCYGGSKCCSDGCSTKCVLPVEKCRRKIDIAFAIHQNVKKEEFEIMKYFVEDSLQRFEISADKSHASLISFGKESKLVFDFKETQDLQGNLIRKISQLPYNPGQGSLVDVLGLACDKIFCTAGGTRDNVPKLLVLITNELAPSNAYELNQRIRTLQLIGIDVLVIGVGNVDTGNLQKVTSFKSSIDNRVFLAKDFNGVLQYGQDIPDFACSEAGSLKVQNESCNVQPTTCVKGAKGSRGRSGTYGERGPSGARGVVGKPGIPGPQGPYGLDGKTGIYGDQGPQGIIGLPGFAGYDGIPGSHGVQGPQGQCGGCGIPGASGEAGQPGVDGFPGAIGYVGPPGPKGRKGEPAKFDPNLVIEKGSDGDPGENAVLGRKGIKGDLGMNGEEGDDASDGIIGGSGEPGDPGDAGFATNFQKGATGKGGDRGEPGPAGIDYAKGGHLNDTTGDKGMTGDRGDAGKKGAANNLRGLPGLKGDIGSIGDVGLIGDIGKKGIKGPSGGRGFPGPKGKGGQTGQNGRAGFPGMVGAKGPRGLTGEQGPRGEAGKSIPGVKGKKGKTGESGIDASNGKQGSEGPQGQTGEDGAPGVLGGIGEEGDDGGKGKQGPIGADGSLGTIGDAGSKGDVGIQGPKGEPGLNGQPIKGEPGKPGPKGANGVYGVVGDPGALGPKGEPSVVNCIEGDCPTPKKGVRGPPGISGGTGPVGPLGKVGPKGNPGGQCPLCPAGQQGISGDSGFPGKPGNKGEQGPRGDNGTAGAKGETGETGPVGEEGLKGIKGLAGEIGKVGPVGADALGDKSLADEGEKGMTGAEGLNGLRGTTGPKGFPGSDGYKGEEGRRGSLGLKGISGQTGSAGENGKDGEKGALGEAGESEAGKPGIVGEVGAEGLQGLVGQLGPKGQKGQPGNEPTEEEKEKLKSQAPGEMGHEGADGDPGEPGKEGSRGPIGSRGLRGPEGPRGEKGFGGAVGDRGEQGQTGDDGDPGTAGKPGTFGRRGAPGEPGKPGLPGNDAIKGEKGETGSRGSAGKKGKDATLACITDDKFDIGFLIDSSKSVKEGDFKKQKEFIREIVKGFPIGNQQSQVGVVQYGAAANIQIRFNDYVTSSALLNAVDDLRYIAAQESRLDLALKTAATDLFTKKSGSRIDDPKTKKALVILGDGFISGGGILGKELSDDALKYAKQIKEQGAMVFSLAVGTEKNIYLLQNFVTDPNYYVDVQTYDFLGQKIDDLKAALSIGCKNVTLQKGEKGKDGRDGPSGDRGKQGAPGPNGFQGSQGVTGFFGLKGEKGQAGDGKADTGFKGLTGRKGEPGLPGLNGNIVTGKDGKPGQKGESGVPLPGIKGGKGEAGPIGQAGPDADQKLCNSVLATDVLFLIDTSSGVGKENFDKMKGFMKSIIKSFDVDNQLTRVGVMTYDAGVRYDIKLSDHNNVVSLFKSIDDLVYVRGSLTRIDKALIEADRNGYTEENGGRVGVNRAIVLMTDGQQSYAHDQVSIPDAVKPLIDGGVLRYAIGIGTEISPVELKVIAEDNVVLANDFDSLINKIETQIRLIGQRGCKGADGLPGFKGQPGDNGKPGSNGLSGDIGLIGLLGPKGLKGLKGAPGVSVGEGRKGMKGILGDAGPPGLPGCKDNKVGPLVSQADIGFVVDASASLYKEGFADEINFIKNVVDAVGPISEDGVRVGVIVYSDAANLRIKFDDFFDTDKLKKAVTDLPYDNAGETRIDLGLEKAFEMFKVDNGARGSSKKVLILMTDGQQTYVPGIKDPSEISTKLIADGIEISAVGIGQEIARVDLESYITRPELLFLASDFSSLINQLVGEVSQALSCEGGPRGPAGGAGDDGPPGEQGSVGPIGDQGKKGQPGDSGFGPQGDKGEKGSRGPKGVYGSAGFRGPDGPVGPRGNIGSKGSEGPNGEKGEVGEDGYIGLFGPGGPVGPKGERGDSTDAEGEPGKPGKGGEQGPKGERGDPGSLPPGSVISDYKGVVGEQGPPGDKGSEGEKGRLLMKPGPIGVSGERGEKGLPGLAPVGEDGDVGPRGLKGLTGNQGPKGSSGKVGITGIVGNAGTDGDPGADGKRIKGDVGEKGEIGPIGEIGKEGDPGFIGLTGSSGRKGERGDPGKQGPQQTRNSNTPAKFKGKQGDKGEAGDAGFDGNIGEPGIAAQGPSGPPGSKGAEGRRGGVGERGETGVLGLEGLPGDKGDKGRVGADGDPGADGSQGPIGEKGDPQPKGVPGDIGSIGEIGLMGRPGVNGTKGEKGVVGAVGQKGPKGVRGPAGFNGLAGEAGKPGPRGERGTTGDKGPVGLTGLAGPTGQAQTGADSGYYIVRHSQNSYVPTCPRNYEVMWEGYSLMYTVGNGHAHSQDLGDAGSCSRSFSTMPFVFCDITNTCKYASRNDFTYWLSGDVRQPMMPVTNSAVEPFISRCVVCNAPDISIAVHSQDVSLPSCPLGYESLWSGFSFLMVAAAGRTGAGQSLASSGSCLEEFRPKPFIECEGARGTCHFFSDKFSFWLITIDKSREFDPQTPTTLNKNKGDDLTSRVSRCRVCIRRPGIDRNVPEGGFLKRFARSVGSWFSV